MFDTILLLAGAAEQSVLPLALRGHNPLLTVIQVGSAAELAAFDSDLLSWARLIAFVTAEIVPQSVLARLGYGAFNFHPGPPSYPGWAPAHFALYDQVRQFGATLHVMVEQVDAGPIIDVAFFPVPADISVFGLEGLAYAHLAQLFWRWANSLATDAAPPSRSRSNGAAGNIPAAPTGRSATSPSTSPRKSSTGASGCSAAIISGLRRPSICTASSFALWHRLGSSPPLKAAASRPRSGFLFREIKIGRPANGPNCRSHPGLIND
jgi:methionyl-tRNA formyltransferase